MSTKLIRFDWAIKKLLRDKANFVILEGFLSVVLKQDIKIVEVLESEGNQETENDKFNKVDLLVKNETDELIIIEVQNNKEYDYFQRMLYGTSKVITEHLNKGDSYSKVKKVFSITVAYFDLGQGVDYVYYGKTEFTGIHSNETLQLSEKQIRLFKKNNVKEVYPEYYIIKADKFDNSKVSDKLDEWIYFLKNSEIPDSFTAPGLKEAKETLAEIKMSETERKEYERFNKRLRDIASENFTKEADYRFALDKKYEEGIEQGIEKGIEQGKSERDVEIAKKSIEQGLDDQTISTITGLTVEFINSTLRS